MKLSASLVSFEVLSLEGVVAVTRDLGFKELDLYGHSQRARAHIEPGEIAENPQKVADRVKRSMDAADLTIGDFFPTFGVGVEDRAVNHPDPMVRKSNRALFDKIVTFTRLTGTPGITLSPGIAFPGIAPSEAFETAVRALGELVDEANAAGIALRVEPHVGSVLHTPELALEMVHRVPGLKITLDYSHFMFLYIDQERVHQLIPYADHFHLRPAKKGYLQTRWVDNGIDFNSILQRLKDVGYAGAIALEFVCQDWYGANQIDVLSETFFTLRDIKPILERLN